MQAFLGIAFVAIGFAQLFAIEEFFKKTLDLGLLDWVLALLVTYAPVVGSVLGMMGAMDAWGWSIWQAGLLFFWYVPVLAVTCVIGIVKSE